MKTINSFRSKLLALTLALVFTPTLWAERFEYNQIYYNTLNDSTAEVTYQTEWSSPSYNHTSVIIPSIVEYNGKVYSIVRIDEAAFYEYTSLTSLSIPKTVTNIGASAFYGCTSLSKVLITASVQTIGSAAFANCTSLEEITCLAAIPPTRSNPLVDGDVFDGVDVANVLLYVPMESIELYRNADQWKDFQIRVYYGSEECHEYMHVNLTALPLITGKLTYRLSTDDGSEIPYVDSVWILNTDKEPLRKFYAQSGDTIDLLFLERGTYILNVYLSECRKSRTFVHRPKWKYTWCDTWNVMWFDGWQFEETASTSKFRLGKDTVIGDYIYSKFIPGTFVRFTDDRKVYVYHEGFDDHDPYTEDLPTGEYLAYDFSAQVGDTLEVFSGVGTYSTYPCVVDDVQIDSETNLRTMTLHKICRIEEDGFFEEYDDMEMTWIEGVGSPEGFLISYLPCGWVGGGTDALLCAYKGDELKYTGDLYEEYGCGDDAEQSPEDLFPTLWGLQQTICSGYYGEEGDEWASGLTGPSQEITMMDGKPYLQWGSWYLREENDKILVYSEIQKKDLVLYDFTLELGDTLTTLNLVTPEFLEYEGIVGIVDYPLSDYDYTYPIDTLVVTELSKETLLDGKEYTRWKFSDGTVYVEGIGSMSETFFHHIADHLPVPVSYLGSYLVCVSKNNKLLYQMDDAEMERLGAECLCEVETSYKSQWCDTWNIMSFDGMVFESSVETDQYKLAQDTIIGEYVYTALTRQPTSSGTNPTSYVAAVRFTEDKKVYIFYDNTEYLLYDFDVQVGDVLETFVGINHYGPWNTCYYAVTGIEEIPEDGTKKIHLEAYVIDDEAESFVIETTWIEGVGSTDGFVMSPLGLGGIVGNSNYKLLCAYKDNELEYTSTWYNEYGCQCNANEINDSFYPTLAGLQRTSFYEHGEDCSANYAQLMISNRTMRIGSNYYLRFDDTPYGTLFLREYHNRVFVYSFADQRDLILYDWNLQVGDSMTYRSIDNYSYPDSEYPVVVNYMARSHSDGTITKEPLGKIYVTNISTVTLLDGNEYKKWTFNNGMEYIQGLGCMDGNYFSLIIPEAVPTCYRADHLVCVSKNNKLLYQMDEAEMERLGAECLCDYIPTIKDNAKNGKIGGRPTPTQWYVLDIETKDMGDPRPTVLRAETFSYTLENDSIVVNGRTFYQLACQSTKDTATTKSVVGALHFSEDKGNRVYFLRDGVEYLLYDFTAEPGDTIEIFAGINNYPQETTYTHVVADKDTTEDGACRMFLEVVFPEETTTVENAEKVWLAGLGSIDGIVHNTAKRASIARSSETQTSIMLCAWREDDCLYTTNHPDYQTLGCVYNIDETTAVDDIHTSPSYQKLLRDGQLLIIHEGKTYNVMGIAIE